MSKQAALNYQVTLDGNDLTDDCDQADLTNEADELDSTTFGNDGVHALTSGLEKNSVQLGWFQNYAAGGASTVIDAAFKTEVVMTLKTQDASVSTTNPLFTFTVLVSKNMPVGGQVGQMAKASLTWPIVSKIVRTTS